MHGFSASLDAWEPWVARLGDRYRVITLDLPGHGLTRAPADFKAGAVADADIVDQLATTLGVSSYVVGGNSMGGGVAWRDAVDHPDHVRALILVDSVGAPMPESRGGGPLIFKLLANPITRFLIRDIDNTALARDGLYKAYYDRRLVTEALVRRYVDLSRAPGHRQILLSGRPGPIDPGIFRRIKAPTLVLHGEKDALIPVAAGRSLANAIPGAVLITYPDTGHVPMEQIPDRSAADAAAFLARLDPRR